MARGLFYIALLLTVRAWAFDPCIEANAELAPPKSVRIGSIDHVARVTLMVPTTTVKDQGCSPTCGAHTAATAFEQLALVEGRPVQLSVPSVVRSHMLRQLEAFYGQTPDEVEAAKVPSFRTGGGVSGAQRAITNAEVVPEQAWSPAVPLEQWAPLFKELSDLGEEAKNVLARIPKTDVEKRKKVLEIAKSGSLQFINAITGPLPETFEHEGQSWDRQSFSQHYFPDPSPFQAYHYQKVIPPETLVELDRRLVQMMGGEHSAGGQKLSESLREKIRLMRIIQLFRRELGYVPDRFQYKGKKMTQEGFINEHFPTLKNGAVAAEADRRDLTQGDFNGLAPPQFDSYESFEARVVEELGQKRAVPIALSWERIFINTEHGVIGRGVHPGSVPLHLFDTQYHGLVIVGADVDPETGRVIKWKAQNSWSAKSGEEGFYYVYPDYLQSHLVSVYLRKAGASGEK